MSDDLDMVGDFDITVPMQMKKSLEFVMVPVEGDEIQIVDSQRRTRPAKWKEINPFYRYDKLGIHCFTPMDNEGKWMAQIRKGNQWITDIEGLRMCDRYGSRA